jgi:hypothetical protein
MTKSLKNVKNEKCTFYDLEYGEKTENNRKGEIHTLGGEIWLGKLKNLKNLEMSTVGHGIWHNLKIMENEKHPLDDLKNDEITEKREK